jgi:hypothetical protein
MCAASFESRMTVCAIAFGSLLGCQGRPRKTVPAGAVAVNLQPVNRKPYGLEMLVLAAVMYPLFVVEPRSSEWIVHRSRTAVARPKMKSTSPST